jgi:hypothetical protein
VGTLLNILSGNVILCTPRSLLLLSNYSLEGDTLPLFYRLVKHAYVVLLGWIDMDSNSNLSEVMGEQEINIQH